jgi:HK97 family phage major capsid protein
LKPRLYEALMEKPGEVKEFYMDAAKNQPLPFLKRYAEVGVKENFFSDMTGALGRMHDSVVQAAWPEQIGRSLINVQPTTEALERFPLDNGAIGYKYAEGTMTRLGGKKPGIVDISPNVLVDASDEWTVEFVEDASWNAMDLLISNVGRAVGQKETELILSLYANVASADLASGAELAAGNSVMGWTQVLTLHNAVRSENWRPKVLAVNELQLHQLLNDDNFKNSVYLPSSETDISQGIIGSILGMKIHASTLVPIGTAYAIDTSVAAMMLLRRDVAIEDWADTKNGKYGVRATTRFGMGVLRSKAIARMTGLKTTLT